MRFKNSIFLGTYLLLSVSGHAYTNPSYCPPPHYVAQNWEKILNHKSIYYPTKKEFVLASARYYTSEGSCQLVAFDWAVSPKFFYRYSHPCGYSLKCASGPGAEILLGRPKS